MKTSIYIFIFSLTCSLLGFFKTSYGEIIYWTDWTSANTGTPGSAQGTITLTDTYTVSVSYIGQLAWAQTSGGGTNYWIPDDPYISPIVDNAPSSTDIIIIVNAYSSNTITFSTPVTNPVMAIVSLGEPHLAVEYIFDAPFDVLSSGTGWWGRGPFYEDNSDPLNPYILVGKEGHGAIQFNGTFSSISWSNPISDKLHGFTVGIVPEPTTLVLFGMVGFIILRKNIRNT